MHQGLPYDDGLVGQQLLDLLGLAAGDNGHVGPEALDPTKEVWYLPSTALGLRRRRALRLVSLLLSLQVITQEVGHDWVATIRSKQTAR